MATNNVYPRQGYFLFFFLSEDLIILVNPQYIMSVVSDLMSFIVLTWSHEYVYTICSTFNLNILKWLVVTLVKAHMPHVSYVYIAVY